MGNTMISGAARGLLVISLSDAQQSVPRIVVERALGIQDLPQPGPGAVQPDLGGLQRHVESLRDFAVLQPFHIAQDQDRLVIAHNRALHHYLVIVLPAEALDRWNRGTTIWIQ